VRRVGDAFAANLDGEAILELVTATAGDALQGDVSRATSRQAPARPVGRDHEAALRLAEDAALEADYVQQAQVGDIRSIACPLHALGAVVSVARRGEPFSGDERALLTFLCGRADVAGSNATRHRFVARQAVTDELTGLANHRRFQEVLDASLDERRSGGSDLALVLIDLDDFKLINDTHGHLTGDEVLRQVGRCLRASCRSGDDPARYGGEEFAVVLNGLELDQVLALGERVREAIADAAISSPTGDPLNVTASIGIAPMRAEDVSRRDLIAAADAALYEAKRRGKDCVAWVDLDDSSAPIDDRIIMSSGRSSAVLRG
jgi:diguanylate cyclase (GGDEF)-like protein